MTTAEGSEQRRPVTIVGAGFSGLVSAFYLQRAGFEVTVYEQSSSVGGLTSTRELPEARVETAANGLLNSATVEELFAALDLPLTPTLATARRRFIFRGGRAYAVPQQLLSLLGLGSVVRLLWTALRYFVSREAVSPRQGESVRKWAERTVGVQASRYLVEAALQGIYAGDPSRMSASLLFGRLFASAPPSASKGAPPKPLKGRGTVTAPEGMGQLMERLRLHLSQCGVQFRLNQSYELASDQVPSAPVVVATSSLAASRVLKARVPEWSVALSKIELLPIVTVTAIFRETDPKSTGFGCLFPPEESRKALGVLKNNFIFSDRVRSGYSETWILGGASSAAAEIVAKSDEEIMQLICSERSACFNVKSELVNFEITRWPQALPHYTVVLEEIVPDLQGVKGNCVLIGNYLGQIGLAKILERAKELPEILVRGGRWTAPGKGQ